MFLMLAEAFGALSMRVSNPIDLGPPYAPPEERTCRGWWFSFLQTSNRWNWKLGNTFPSFKY
ncbi:MAG: hypothetical protein ACTS6P_01980 [Candidatus Hodgkinia cicadicola]